MKELHQVYLQNFFARSTLKVAPELLGALLCRRLKDGRVLSAPIVEVEAYTADDPACHASRGITKRCEIMFGPAGYAYVYFIYGMYHCLNVVTEGKGTPGAVLIRAVGIEGGNGPGKLCKNLEITRNHNGVNLMDTSGALWIAKGQPIKSTEIRKSGRIGLSAAQDRQWRFFIKDNPYVSALAKSK